jgi:hypothetical protein
VDTRAELIRIAEPPSNLVNKPVAIVGFLTFNSLLAFFTSEVKGIGVDTRRRYFVNKAVVCLTIELRIQNTAKYTAYLRHDRVRITRLLAGSGKSVLRTLESSREQFTSGRLVNSSQCSNVSM